jgi:hypothetical protein
MILTTPKKAVIKALRKPHAPLPSNELPSTVKGVFHVSNNFFILSMIL